MTHCYLFIKNAIADSAGFKPINYIYVVWLQFVVNKTKYEFNATTYKFISTVDLVLL